MIIARVHGKKAIDQVAIADETYPGTYVPLTELQVWTGQGLSAQGALNHIAVYQCVRVLSNVFAQLPLKVYRRVGESGKAPATDHPLYDLLHTRPNPDMTSFVWRKHVMRDLATWGNHYSEKVYDAIGRLAALYPIRPDRIIPVYDANGRRQYDYLGRYGEPKRMRPGTIFHVQGQTTNGLVGSSPIAELRKTLALSTSAETYGRSVFDNGARPGMVFSHPKNLSDGAITRLAAQGDALLGARNANKTIVAEEGLTITPIGFPPEDAQFLETRLLQHRLLYGAYGVPPHKVGDLERATFSNIEHQSIEFIQDGAMPWIVNFEQETKIQLIDEDDIFAEILVDGYLRGDAKTRAEANAIRWQHGTMNPDEWRAQENEDPIPDGLGKTYYIPVNYMPAAAPEAMTETVEPVDDQAEGDGPPGPPQLVAVKSVRCDKCSALLAELASPPYRLRCRRCKTITERGEPAVKSTGQRYEYDDAGRLVATFDV